MKRIHYKTYLSYFTSENNIGVILNKAQQSGKYEFSFCRLCEIVNLISRSVIYIKYSSRL